MPERDPELAALLLSVRQLTGQAHRLSTSINETLEELTEFADAVAHTPNRRLGFAGYEGNDRRA